ncbi:hypothetical protein [Geothrix sp. PMB-07]|uniref:hypothetical protein n=1 Tax=Geothrix sp. PMB-07 TaxID=3068640 RepID=UPI002740542F|nr:hypothetical protein [Geothrix sp. PMB-07]WLT30715.1 hypothetical protein Q9293_13420 [Geothrix sp. PMB-07]
MKRFTPSLLLAALLGGSPLPGQTARALSTGGKPQAPPEVTDEAGKAIQQELSEPFCYFMVPTDQLGFKNAPKATIVTHDGAFVSPYGQLSFLVGAPGSARPVNKRVKTLLDGHLPVIQFSFDRDGLHYAFEAFATPVSLDPKNNLITFIACTVSNPGPKAQKGVIRAQFGDIAPEISVDPFYGWARAYRQNLKQALEAQRSTRWHTKRFMDEEAFTAGLQKAEWTEGRGLLGGHLVFSGPAVGAHPHRSDGAIQRAAVDYTFELPAKGTRTWRFKMPAVPVSLAKAGAVREVMEASHDDYRARTLAYWKREIAQADRFMVADPKVMDTLKTSLVNDLIASELSEEGHVYQRVNKLHYNYFWIRDASYFVRTYDMLGMPLMARQMLDSFLVWRDGKPVAFFAPGSPQPTGARLSVQDDYWGQVLWAFGAHLRTQHDQALLEQIYPLLGPHIEAFVAKCAKDPRGLWPVAGPYDNEAINGHYTGHSFWALLGLKYAVSMAQSMGRADDAAKWQKVHDDYSANFLKQLRELASQSEGYIPPGMDKATDGSDWDNASAGLYPFEALAKDDPLVRKTLDMVRDFNYREGVITYGGNAWVAKQRKREGKKAAEGTLHHYEIFSVTEGNTILGEQRKVVEDLYSILAHTGSTHSGFEYGIPAWTTRDPGDNFTPHGWFAARYLAQVRNMLVREEGRQVHLASVLAPKWAQPGQQVRVSEAPTFFGRVSYTLDCRADGATLTLDNHWKPGAGPESLVLHLPWFARVTSATIDGVPTSPASGALVLPAGVRQVQMTWSQAEKPNLSYEEAVRLYLEKYYRQPAGANYDFLFPQPQPVPTP